MKLHFETIDPFATGKEIPVLEAPERVNPETIIDEILVDGRAVEVDESIINTFRDVVAEITSEHLPSDHYRDCVHFVMAMQGIWLPTCRPFEKLLETSQVCDESDPLGFREGVITTGIPNDSRCLGFGNARYVYSHSALGVPTSDGLRYLQKLGPQALYSLASPDQTLEIFDNEIAHPIVELSVQLGDHNIQWSAASALVN